MCAQLCLTLCSPMDYGLPGSSVHGIFQARILECVAISFRGDLPYPRIEPDFPAFQAGSLALSHQEVSMVKAISEQWRLKLLGIGEMAFLKLIGLRILLPSIAQVL